jgi:hypothetical protein
VGLGWQLLNTSLALYHLNHLCLAADHSKFDVKSTMTAPQRAARSSWSDLSLQVLAKTLGSRQDGIEAENLRQRAASQAVSHFPR